MNYMKYYIKFVMWFFVYFFEQQNNLKKMLAKNFIIHDHENSLLFDSALKIGSAIF